MSEYLSHLSVEELNKMLNSAIIEGLTNQKIADIQYALGKAEYNKNQKRTSPFCNGKGQTDS